MTPLRRDVHRSQVTLTTVFTVCGGVLLVLGLVMFVVNSMLALTLSISALMIAVALDHVVAFLERRRVRRSLAIAVVTLGTLAVAVGLGFIVIPPAITQGKEFVKQVPGLVQKAQHSRLFTTVDTRFNVAERITQLPQKLPQYLSGAAGPVLAFVGSVFNALGAAVTIFFLAIFMLVFGGSLVRDLVKEALPERRERYAQLLHKIYRLIGGYLGGLFFICSINATCTTTFLAIIGLKFYVPLGLASGFSSLVPYAGPFVAGASIAAIAFITGGVWKGLACAIYFVVYGQIEGNVLSPLIFRRTVHVNPLIVTLSILYLGEIAGVVGAVLAVPITACVQIVVREILHERRERLHLPPTPLNTPTDLR